MYDPAIARWMSVDPLAEKYYSMSPYGYCDGDPITIVDPQGLWISIYDKNNEYRFMEGKLFQYQKEGNYAGNFILCEEIDPSSFIGGVYGALLQLFNGAGGKTGIELIAFFENDRMNAYIYANSKKENEIEITGYNRILLNESTSGSTVPVERGKLATSPFWIDVGHELAHRQDYLLRGAEANKTWYTDSEGKDIIDSEKYATHIENLMRSSTNFLPLRTHYQSQGMWGYEPSRIINRKGESLFFEGTKYTPLRQRTKK